MISTVEQFSTFGSCHTAGSPTHNLEASPTVVTMTITFCIQRYRRKFLSEKYEICGKVKQGVCGLQPSEAIESFAVTLRQEGG